MKYSVALVEYLNTWPFSTGVKESGLEDEFDFHHVTPAECARLFNEGKADISLCPVGALSDLPEHQIRGKFCIGADGPVETVVLLSQVPIGQIRSVRLDSHSRTSNKLIQILADRLWMKNWDFYMGSGEPLPDTCLMIGDKVFEHKSQYTYHYDLASAWKELTGLPMVFAVWITRPGIPDEVIDLLDKACSKGLEILQNGKSGLSDWQKSYLLEKISYPLDRRKRDAMKQYLEFAQILETVKPQ
jgi:chorismate dehydratase